MCNTDDTKLMEFKSNYLGQFLVDKDDGNAFKALKISIPGSCLYEKDERNLGGNSTEVASKREVMRCCKQMI